MSEKTAAELAKEKQQEEHQELLARVANHEKG